MRSLLRYSIMVAVIVATVAFAACRVDPTELFFDESDFLVTGRTQSFFTAIQIDPRSEDSAGPQFVVAGDLDGNGTIDLVSAWNQSQPVQIHLQRRDAAGVISFETVVLPSDSPVLSVAGLSIADVDLDGIPDVIVLVKDSAVGLGACLDGQLGGDPLVGSISVYFGTSDTSEALQWEQVVIGASLLSGVAGDDDTPESGGFTSFAVEDMDQDGDPDIVVAWNSTCEGNGIVLFTNNGPAAARDGTWTATRIPDSLAEGDVNAVAVADVDRDGDLDIIASRPLARSLNVRWFRNPAIDVADEFHATDGQWHVGTVGQIATQADLIEVADIDGDGRVDVLVRSTGGLLLQWLKGPQSPTTEPVGLLPWQVFTLAEFVDRVPEAIAVGDLNFDGKPEVIVSAQGALLWFGSAGADSVFDQWSEHLIIDDAPEEEQSDPPATTDPGVDPDELIGATLINSIVVVDLDGDGAMDLVTTLDRAGLSGLTNDALVWFRNTNRPPG